MSKAVSTYSVSFRLQRTTTEFAFVSVPVTSDLLLPQADGTARLNGPALAQRAIELGHASSLTWHPEGTAVELHPIQVAPPAAQAAQAGFKGSSSA
jgi:hypothetical protein